jgi:hypothetical protein
MTAIRSEFSHPVRTDRLGAAPLTVVLEPDRAVRGALAERFDLVELPSLRAELTLRRRPETGWIEVSGAIAADVVQTCVVTTDPVAARVEAEVLELFDDSGGVGDDEVILDPMADTPEPLADMVLDVGEIVAQTLGLSLNPYPRTPGANLAEATVESAERAGASPFAGLAALKGGPVKKG